MPETQTFSGTLESVNKAETGQNKPYLKIKAIPDGLEKARTYNYHPPWELKDKPDEAKAHIEETRQGLLPLIDSEISFAFVENPNPNGDFPFKNIKEFPAEFEPAAEPKPPVVDEEHVKDEHEPASTRPSDKPEEKATDPAEEGQAYEAHKLEERARLVSDVEYYLGVAKEAWINIIHPFDNTTTNTLDATDKEAIEKIAVHLRMNKRGR